MLWPMKRIFIASRGNPEHMATLFRKELPSHVVTTEQPKTDDGPVPYIVVGRPLPGVIAAVPGLELVLSLNAGIEHLLASGEVPGHLPIVRLVDDGLAEGMCEWVLAQALAWHRNLLVYKDLQAKGEWAPCAEKLARERTVTILGAGALGSEVARHFVRFGFKTRSWSRSGRAIEGAQSFAGREKLMDAVSGADILVNLLPMTAETADVVDAKVLAALAKGAFFINGARGGHVVDADLIGALDGGHISGAALDVFRIEPLPAEDTLWRHPKVLLSPHVAAPTHADAAVKEMAENIRRFERGEKLPHIVDRTLGY
ncbi:MULTISPECIES: glyoxylate/hydroxypyruvate reductase A [Ensifer]|uniref:2-hydroxyacid dehydrogenase n=1 Tax=Ensifer TaxID=106591 RepID=UPI000DDD1EB6|nr:MULTISPECIES: glyoxylate/hydroxypyruvate reductase A [Ensifer]MBD9496384.1 glyoxylate/hydroxypyruvate reductase A [Ensifer sp. ENS01]MBD9626436.1 glyoxylate/hydroxypyruvate reductase A [Ensifer sp. ENS06]MDF8356536.1 glyoxylate/hydroxypyruvate reductase A [Ensifer adhaerens]THA65087.1 glyoxylate/hydroxypyruvate reductase A [Ensifer adhaerens]